MIKNVGSSDDINATVSAVKSLGGIVERQGADVVIFGRNKVDSAVVDCNESGSTLRFLIPVAAALGINAKFTGRGRLLERPIEDLSQTLKSNGVTLKDHTVSGKLKSGEYSVNAVVSSQFVTGLLFALSYSEGKSRLRLCGNAVSRGYIDATLDVLKEFGADIKEDKNGFIINGGLKQKEVCYVEGDWSGAAFPLSVGAICGEVTVKGLKYPTLQADGKIVEILKKFGASVNIGKDFVTVKSNKLSGIDVDCENCPDIAQVICSVAAFAEGKTNLYGVERLKIKESDRIAAIINTLKTCKVKAEYSDKVLTVYGGKPMGGEIDGGKDHRTVMSAVVLSSGAMGNSTVTDVEYCSKSYPNFIDDIKRIGGKVDVGF